MNRLITTVLICLATVGCTGISTISQPYNESSMNRFTYAEKADLSYNTMYDSTDFIICIRHVHNTHSNFTAPKKITLWLDPTNQNRQFWGIRLGAQQGLGQPAKNSAETAPSSLYSITAKEDCPQSPVNYKEIPVTVQKKDFDGVRSYEIRSPLNKLSLEENHPAKIALGIESETMPDYRDNKNSGDNRSGKPDARDRGQGGGMKPPDGKAPSGMPPPSNRQGKGKPGNKFERGENENQPPTWISVKLF